MGNFLRQGIRYINKKMNLKEKKYLLLDLDGVCYGKHNNYSLERVFGQVSKRMTQFISEKLKIDTEFIMSEFKNERKEVKIEDIVQEVSVKSQKKRKVKAKNSLGVFIFILISGILGLLASSLIFNIFSDSFEDKKPKKEFINKN